MRVPVLKTCDHCSGSGEIGVGMTDGTTAGNFTSWVTCHDCEGRGVVETGMFVEILDEWTTVGYGYA